MTKSPSTSSRKKPRKPHVISFRITESEYTLLAHKAATANISVNDLARTICLARSESLTVETSSATDPALITQIHYIGHNLNQLVKNAHIFGRVSPRVEGLCERIQSMIDEAIK